MENGVLSAPTSVRCGTGGMENVFRPRQNIVADYRAMFPPCSNRYNPVYRTLCSAHLSKGGPLWGPRSDNNRYLFDPLLSFVVNVLTR